MVVVVLCVQWLFVVVWFFLSLFSFFFVFLLFFLLFFLLCCLGCFLLVVCAVFFRFFPFLFVCAGLFFAGDRAIMLAASVVW